MIRLIQRNQNISFCFNCCTELPVTGQTESAAAGCSSSSPSSPELTGAPGSGEPGGEKGRLGGWPRSAHKCSWAAWQDPIADAESLTASSGGAGAYSRRPVIAASPACEGSQGIIRDGAVGAFDPAGGAAALPLRCGEMGDALAAPCGHGAVSGVSGRAWPRAARGWRDGCVGRARAAEHRGHMAANRTTTAGAGCAMAAQGGHRAAVAPPSSPPWSPVWNHFQYSSPI